MSKLSNFSKKETAKKAQIYEKSVTNFMGGVSFTVSPIQTLKMIAASSIFGESQYYREGGIQKGISNRKTLQQNSIFSEIYSTENISASEVFENAIDAALNYDFKATLDLAVELRSEHNMRLNPSVIFMKAALHESRVEFNQKYPGYMRGIAKKINQRPDDIKNQFDFYMYKNGKKNNIPNIVKKSWAENLESLSAYHINKYKNSGLIDLVRISHANNDLINQLMRTGSVQISSSEQTWETLRSAGESWDSILKKIKMPHMALLRNLRGIVTEISDSNTIKKVLNELKDGVKTGKQFPFRYWSAYNAIANDVKINYQQVLDALEECIDLAVENFPKISGNVVCLCDNSGSAHRSFTSEYGSVKVSEIANLSSIITGKQADGEGYVGVFGDRLEMIPVSKRNGVLTQLKNINYIGTKIGHGTENGIWLFWNDAIKNKKHYDNVFIYSDQQAGHGGLFGISDSQEYEKYATYGSYLDVLKLIEKYRKDVNPKVNVFSIQVAGYNNNVIPENIYRGAILSGWTGKEAQYANAIIESWNEIENK